MSLRSQLLKKLRNKEYRDAFVAEYIYSRIPLKIRAMREKRKMSQKALGAAAGVKQEWISKLEDPTYGRLTISTLLNIASAFDCGLIVDFVPFSKILNGATHLSPESFEVASFSDDYGLHYEPVVLASIDTGSIVTATKSANNSVESCATPINVPDELNVQETETPISVAA
jgi:transcriptional regulator with XRE-family HTH domain